MRILIFFKDQFYVRIKSRKSVNVDQVLSFFFYFISTESPCFYTRTLLTLKCHSHPQSSFFNFNVLVRELTTLKLILLVTFNVHPLT